MNFKTRNIHEESTMKLRVSFLLTFVLILAFGFTSAVYAVGVADEMEYDSEGRPLWLENQIYVKFKQAVRSNPDEMIITETGIPSVDDKLFQLGVEELQRSFRQKPIPVDKNYPDLTKIYTLNLPVGTSIEGAIQFLNSDPNVQYAERVPANHPDETPNDPEYANQYALQLVRASNAWNVHKGEDGDSVVVVGICDSGVDWQHPDLQPNMYHRLGEDADGDGVVLELIDGNWVFDPDDVNGVDDDNNGYVDDFIGWDFASDGPDEYDNDPDDSANRYHGTHVAGIAAAVTDNEIGVASVSWNVKILGTSHSSVSSGGISQAYSGLVYLAENGADVINASWGSSGYSQSNAAVIEYITALGAIFVTSAGNTGRNEERTPSSYPGAISVTSVGQNDFAVASTTHGISHDLAAPGDNILSTWPGGGYNAIGGTSMASPMVAGVFALLKSMHPDWSHDDLVKQVLWTTDDIDEINPHVAGLMGTGRVNAHRSLIESDVYPEYFEIESAELISSDASLLEGFLEPGDEVELSLVLRNWTHVLGDSAATFTLSSSDPDIVFTNSTFQDTILPDNFFTVEGPFTFSVDADANTEVAELWLVIESDRGGFAPSDTIRYPVIVNTTQLSLDFLDLYLNYGDVHSELVTITNTASGEVSFTAGAFNLNPESILFHLDTYNAYDGLSWWCGDPSINGYPNGTLQFMDLPPLDLSGSSNPMLTFMVDWDIEEANGEPPFDGWDGANVWVSTDGGDNFEIMLPVTPAYTADALYSFGIVWGLGSVPGWTGQNADYLAAEFDLSAYASEEVVVRFAFASDPAVTGGGLWVDNIVVADDNGSLFENNGFAGGGLVLEGYPTNLVPSEWVEFPNGEGTVTGNSTYDLQMDVNTRSLAPGAYNSTAVLLLEEEHIIGDIPISLTLTAPAHDVGIDGYSISDGVLTLLKERFITADLSNRGLNDENEFLVVCNIMDEDETPLYTDTVTVDGIAQYETLAVTFAGFTPMDSGLLDVEIQLHGLEEDYNDFNNVYTEATEVLNLVDTFSDDTGIWTMDGWGLTSGVVGHTDIFSAHVNAGTIPYGPDMNSTMSWADPIDVSELEDLVVTYWTIFLTEDYVDVCYFEASTDGLNWVSFNEHSGSGLQWVQWEIQLGDFIADAEDLWFRFRFESNESVHMNGVFIDDVELWTQDYTGITGEHVLPEEFRVHQNYPNPFNPVTRIQYELPSATEVQVQIFDIRGRLITTLADTWQDAGYYELEWQGLNQFGQSVSTGVYLARVNAGPDSEVIKMVYLK